MKKLFLSLVAMMIATVSFAQSSLVVTLTHGDDIKMFYGIDAFKEAHQAAEHGDVINLSGGGFNSVSITKAIAVRGTGIKDANPTYITGDFTIDIPSDVNDRLSFEGCRILGNIYLQGTLTNAYFLRNDIRRFDVNDNVNSNLVNAMFANCNLYGMSFRGKSSVQFLNSHVELFANDTPETAEATFLNCVLRPRDYWNWGHHIAASDFKSSRLVNCILFGPEDGHMVSLPSTSSAYNCIALGDSDGAFNDLQIKQNCSIAGFDIFQDSDPWKDLTEEAKAKYIGNDGTPIGMFGGVLPYDMTPSYPQITKMIVANKTTADGKLSVDIEVSAAK